jgi:alpha,alpha-trehalase
VRRPEDAKMTSDMRTTTRKLAALCPVTIISGRDLSDIANMVGLTEVSYAGSHGFDIADAFDGDARTQKGRECLPALDSAEKELKEVLSGTEGILVERKKFSIAVHYRNADAGEINEVESAVEAASSRHPELRSSSGKKVYELQPDLDWDKGKAVKWLMGLRKTDGKPYLPFYIGDDTTDEDAFKAIKGVGVGIVVDEGSKRSAADYVLRDPEDVREFLSRMIDVLEGRDL